MNSYSFLFSSVKAAQEVAYALRAKWDNCNGVELLACDNLALRLAAALCNAEYCEVGKNCDILDNIRESRSVLMFGFSDTVPQVIAAQIASCFNQNLQLGNDNFWQMALKVAQDVEELRFAEADRRGSEADKF